MGFSLIKQPFWVPQSMEPPISQAQRVARHAGALWEKRSTSFVHKPRGTVLMIVDDAS